MDEYNNTDGYYDEWIKLDKLDLYYEVHLVGFEGENFEYNVYFDGVKAKDKLDEVKAAVDSFASEYNDAGIYPGYLDVTVEKGKVFIYQDIGGEMYEDENAPIHGLLKALNNVSGIKKVMINEGMDF